MPPISASIRSILRRPAPLLAGLLLLPACAPSLQHIGALKSGVAVGTVGSNSSMIYLAQTGAGVVLIDLGWTGARGRIEDALADMSADTSDVAAVFITHAHRDHIAGWRAVATAPFYMAAAEAELFFGRVEPQGWIPELAGRIKDVDLPDPEEVTVRTFSQDTALVFGQDTLRALLVPGHTPGSTAYLFRGTLFVGDAVAHPLITGFRPALHAFSDDAARAAASLDDLLTRVQPFGVRYLCTAHGKCTRFDEEFVAELREAARDR